MKDNLISWLAKDIAEDIDWNNKTITRFDVVRFFVQVALLIYLVAEH